MILSAVSVYAALYVLNFIPFAQFLLLNILWRHIADYDQTLNYSFTIVIRLLYTYITYTYIYTHHKCVLCILYFIQRKNFAQRIFAIIYHIHSYWINLLGASDGLKWVLTVKCRSCVERMNKEKRKNTKYASSVFAY